jgi:hypothetical protein
VVISLDDGGNPHFESHTLTYTRINTHTHRHAHTHTNTCTHTHTHTHSKYNMCVKLYYATLRRNVTADTNKPDVRIRLDLDQCAGYPQQEDKKGGKSDSGTKSSGAMITSQLTTYDGIFGGKSRESAADRVRTSYVMLCFAVICCYVLLHCLMLRYPLTPKPLLYNTITVTLLQWRGLAVLDRVRIEEYAVLADISTDEVRYHCHTTVTPQSHHCGTTATPL